jgi:hypothetical protein
VARLEPSLQFETPKEKQGFRKGDNKHFKQNICRNIYPRGESEGSSVFLVRDSAARDGWQVDSAVKIGGENLVIFLEIFLIY